jgi:hypothetical protein
LKGGSKDINWDHSSKGALKCHPQDNLADAFWCAIMLQINEVLMAVLDKMKKGDRNYRKQKSQENSE